jgi:hypothetical protein
MAETTGARFPLFAKGAPFLARSIGKQTANISLPRKICTANGNRGAAKNSSAP